MTMGVVPAHVAEPKEYIEYIPSPTMARFHADSDSLYRFIMGPFGSGKSTACVMEILMRSYQQAPYNGVRKTRWVALRNTYPELRSTTIKTWTDWVSEQVCPINWNAPITGRMRVPLDDGTVVDMEIVFVSMDKPKDIAKALGQECTGYWVNEARQFPKSVIDVLSRVGRYPPQREGGPTWYGIIGDTNPPDTDHWYYRLAEEEPPENWAFFHQPGGLIRLPNGEYAPNPAAENIANLPGGYHYYFQQIPGKDREYINVYVLGRYGVLFDGRPVYEDIYDDEKHVSPFPLGIFRGLPLLLGWDFGNTPACVAAQETRLGVFNVLREWQCTRGGIYQFATEVVKPALMSEFAGMTVISRGDPAGTAGAQGNIEITCFGELNKLGIHTVPAPTNEFTMRREAVLYYLSRTAHGRPAFQLDPRCKILRKGFQGGYQFSRVQVIGEERYKDVPTKNAFSHLQDALQYVCLGASQPIVAQRAARPAMPTKGRMRGLT